VIGYSPVGQGLLVDGLTPEKMKSIRVAKITGITWAQLEGLRAVISEIAKSHGKTMAQVHSLQLSIPAILSKSSGRSA